ncbi:MAG: ferritin family protein, partial [Thermodesulfobacteriota bacterium]
MRSRENNALNAIKAAMEAEMDAHNFYSRAAQKTKNPKGRDMFSQLADFERNHFHHLKALYDSLKGEEKWISYSGTTFSGKGKKIRTELTVSNEVGCQADDI